MKYINEFITYMKGRQMSEGTITGYTRNLGYVFDVIKKPEEEVTIEDLENYKFESKELSSSTLRTRLSAIKTYYAFLMRRKYITENPVEYLDSVKVNNKEKIT